MLPESSEKFKDKYDKLVDFKAPKAIDSSKLYENYSEIFWFRHSDKVKPYERESQGKPHSELVSMIELTSRITNLTSANLLLFQIVYMNYVFLWDCNKGDSLEPKLKIK